MEFCENAKEVFQFIGYIVTGIKILVPVALIVIGVIKLGKAVIADDDDAIKTATTSLLKKFILGVLIFFVPTIVKALFSLVNAAKDTGSDSEVCIKCITDPGSCG